MTFSTERWEEARKAKPSGSHLWQFAFRVPGKVQGIVSTDGPWAKTRDRVLKALKESHGSRNLSVELLP